ncbi:hypothetical protein A2872_03475 [Candidatus Gottesmanbacteria bacterium RIFCSPHIGHO2_01_FULL_42_12]|uniref:Uncharacterized protein n=1 Tax=Candidatus Gottesmanbacteria bacterium RIFCSPHIGHO2_01_FULL_42_12 TaxID=1798377 RepID=A0A1F5Z4H9_9BACT|nr:MAG: hypothetical protein A2872_03475 [Candidatus Gottesmanbacteria bacterium RIFCSPHIGHO2_01_FULL_42_12]
MVVYVFGNADVKNDAGAIKVAKKLPGFNFRFIKPNEDIDFESKTPIILDVVEGINKITVFNNIDDIAVLKSSTVHDFDLGFQLKYLKKLGKIEGVTIVGIPASAKDRNHLRIKLILRKLVAQDMQGS